MKAFLLFIITAFLLAPPVYADWAKNLKTQPAAGAAVPSGVNPQKEYFFFILRNTTTASGWIFLQAGINVDICMDNDVDLEDSTTSTLTAELLFVNDRNGDVAPENNFLAGPLLGVTFTGISPTRCIFDVKGDMWVKVDNIVLDTNQDGLFSISHRKD